MAKIVLKIVVGCSLMFERLFWVQQGCKDMKPIGITDVWRETEGIRDSAQRKVMSEVIETRVKLSNHYNKAGAKAFALEPIEAVKNK